MGRIAGLHGLRGELKCDPTGAGRAVFLPGAHLDAGDATPRETLTLRSVREHKGRLLVTFEGLNDATAAQRLIGGTLYAETSAIELDEGEHLDRDLVGCTLVDPRGKALGTVSAVEHYPANDMLVVGGALVPMVKAFVASIDTREKIVRVHDLPAGLLNPAEADADA